jgi:hypothetical protein
VYVAAEAGRPIRNRIAARAQEKGDGSFDDDVDFSGRRQSGHSCPERCKWVAAAPAMGSSPPMSNLFVIALVS